MYQTKKTFVKPDMRMSDLIIENPSFLMLLEHFQFNLVVHDHTVKQISLNHNVNPDLVILLCNLYNGFTPGNHNNLPKEDVGYLISFLRNSHQFYKSDKYPEIKLYIKEMNRLNNSREMKLVEQFFDNYFSEVTEHLEYEEVIAFPEISRKLNINVEFALSDNDDYSVSVYRDHHTDIESKLSELKNLLLKYIPLQDDRVVRRKLLVSLFELESDLSIHSQIEETILIPLVKKLEAVK